MHEQSNSEQSALIPVNSQIHFIFRHQNPKTGEFEEKHLKVPPKPSFDKKTNLFTLQLLCVTLIATLAAFDACY